MKKLSKNYQKKLSSLRQYLQAVGYQKMSQRCILGGVKEFLNWLENKGILQIEEVHRDRIKSYHEYLENRPNKLFEGGLSSKMIRDGLWSVSLLFKQLEKQNKVRVNPLSGYPLPRVENEKREILSQEEIQLLYEQCKEIKERCVLHIYYGLGLRRSEGESLNIGDIDYKNGWLYVRKGKGGKGRNMPLTDRVKRDLKTYLLNDRPRVSEQALLLNKMDRRLQGQSALIILRKLLLQAKIEKKIDLHCLRHSITTHLIQRGMPLEQVRIYLGHSHLESTQRYIRYDHKRIFKQQIHPFHR